MGKSIERDGVFGKYTEHFDDDGNKIGESKIIDGVMGKYVEHRDTEGRKIGESKYREGVFEDYTEHFAKDGRKLGESKEREGIIEDYTAHFDRDGRKIGESKHREGIFRDYTEHTGAAPPFGADADPDSDDDTGEFDGADNARGSGELATPAGKGFWFFAAPIVLVGLVGWALTLLPFEFGGDAPTNRPAQIVSSQTEPSDRPRAAAPASAAPAPLPSGAALNRTPPQQQNVPVNDEPIQEADAEVVETVSPSQQSQESDTAAAQFNLAFALQAAARGTIVPYTPPQPLRVKGTSVRIRAAPFANDATAILSVVNTDDPLNVIGAVMQDDGFVWWQVRLPDQQTGFVRSDLATSPQ